MNITFPENVPDANGETAAIQAASRQLEEMAGNSAIPASAEWGVVQDPKGNRRYSLTLSDYLGRVSEEFTVAELHSPQKVHRRLIHLWGDHLEMRSHKLREKTFEPAAGD
jgi:hypothetical protein